MEKIGKLGNLGFRNNIKYNNMVLKHNNMVDEFNNWLENTNTTIDVQLKKQKQVINFRNKIE